MSDKIKKPRLTPAQKEAMKILKRCGSMLLDIQSDGKELWSFWGYYGQANSRTIRCLIDKGVIKPAGDCMLGGKSQTWIPA